MRFNAPPCRRDGRGGVIRDTLFGSARRLVPASRIGLALAVAVAAAFVLVPSARAATNVVPNPGFEQGGCGTTPVICGWTSGDSMSQDTSNPHAGSASMHLECGTGGCYYDLDYGPSIAAGAISCVAFGPGAHAASFWYRDVVGAQVSLDAVFFSGRDCSSEQGRDSLAQTWPSGGGWQHVTGALHAPTYTQSALFSVGISGCDASCSLSANFDDIDIADVGDPTPTIASFTPTTGWVGTRVWIYGFDFLGATSVTFNGAEAQFTVGSDGFIDANVPIGATTGPISVTTANGTGWSTPSFALVPPPTISSFTPTDGRFGDVVDIRGSSFTGALWVQFNQHYADFTVDSDSEIHATVPDGATTGPISVTTVSGTGSSAASFTVPTPTISSFTPTSGPPGTSVDIRGTNFTGASIVTFNGVQATFNVDSDSEIHATVPTGGRTGWISVATNAGSAISSSSFSVVGGAPTITSFTPIHGPVGTTVDIQGTNLTGATSVTFGNTPASFTVDSDSEIHATVPNGAMNSYIHIATPTGTAWSGALFIVNASPPWISSFTPSSGPVGTSVDILGLDFTGATSVTFNGSAAAFVVDSDTEIHATVPSGATSGAISVTTYAGSGTTSAPFTVTKPAPTISSFSPSSGPVGTSVDILGLDFTGATSVTFNGASATFTVDSDSELHASVPSGATSGSISVTTPAGSATTSAQFTVTPASSAPTITSFSPTRGPAGTTVTIGGSNFADVTSVRLGGVLAAFAVNSPTTITAVVPGVPAGRYQWSVTNPAGTATSTGTFKVLW
jgi:large repetitive protein